jgi:hypothetical protein
MLKVRSVSNDIACQLSSFTISSTDPDVCFQLRIWQGTLRSLLSHWEMSFAGTGLRDIFNISIEQNDCPRTFNTSVSSIQPQDHIFKASPPSQAAGTQGSADNARLTSDDEGDALSLEDKGDDHGILVEIDRVGLYSDSEHGDPILDGANLIQVLELVSRRLS